MQDDEVIIGLVLAGNKEAYAQIIQRYHKKIVLLLRKMLGTPQNEQDLVQEIFIKAYYHLGDYSRSYDFAAWLYRIASNHCLDELRKRKRAVSIADLDIEPADAHTPELEYLAKEQRSYLRQRLMTLEEKYRVVLELRYLHFLSYEEISDKLDVPVSTVRTRLSRGKTKLREAISKTDRGGDFNR